MKLDKSPDAKGGAGDLIAEDFTSPACSGVEIV
jgi:hypothetical protein